MRKASITLGIIGGVLAIIVGLLTLFGGVVASYGFSDFIQNEAMADYNTEEFADFDFDYGDADEIEVVASALSSLLVLYSAATIIAGILGLVGGLVVRKKNTLAGVLMIIGCVILLFTVHIISFILLLLGGIFAFIKDKTETPDMGYDELSFQ